MFRQVAVVAAVEVTLYAVIGIAYMMVYAGGGEASGVWIALVPFAWGALALRLWVGIAVASALAPAEGPRFLVAAFAIGVLSATFLMIAFAGSAGGWSVAWPIYASSVLAHLAAAVQLIRAARAQAAHGAQR